jgi:alkylation response protein AidB-like acyl-CoA dehydrogenase
VTEPLDSFRSRTRAWIAANLPPIDAERAAWLTDVEDGAAVRRNRELMRALSDAGLSGICYPTGYGGQGLGVQHLAAFTEEAAGRELPLMFHLPTLTIVAPTLLDLGTEEQKRRHLPAILRGDELWVQFLSEPSGGSDLASARTRATRDGDTYVVNGSKIWSSGAHRADFAMCVCRTDWSVPKHAGLSVLIMATHDRGVEIRPIRQVNGTSEFCQVFFDDARVPVANLVGAENDG